MLFYRFILMAPSCGLIVNSSHKADQPAQSYPGRLLISFSGSQSDNLQNGVAVFLGNLSETSHQLLLYLLGTSTDSVAYI